MIILKSFLFTLALVCISCPTTLCQTEHSIAREWNEVLLASIRNDFARPTVHARNLFHVSAAMYDAWVVYEGEATPFFLGNTVSGYEIPFEGIDIPSDSASILSAQEMAISFAAYRIITERFRFSPGFEESFLLAFNLFEEKGYDANHISTDYSDGSPASLGNYIAQSILDFGLQDGANEQFDYTNLYYRPVNPPMVIFDPGNPRLTNPNRWQPLTLELFIDQAGNLVPGNTPQFLSPEWGNVVPFSLSTEELTIHSRDDNEWWVFHDPGPPPYQLNSFPDSSLDYIWGFTLVALWSSHLSPIDSVIWDISPRSLGNINVFPQTFEEMRSFYNLLEGGDTGTGHTVNPHTGQPYEPQFVPRGDYARVLAEFWADGPDSETPPGHWFTILNYVNDHPLFERRFKGEGPVLSTLEWDVKAYFILGGTMHDAAVSTWGIKGYYDYPRPVSVIRYLGDLGQRTDSNLPSYDPNGIPLEEGLIDIVMEGDSLAGDQNQHVGKIKLYTWKGPDYIIDPETDEASVGWILAENWWPYQRPSFVSPPFAGYISGHSTFSRAAAEVLTMLTGDPFFPGGLGEFLAPKNEFLVFEEGPSQDIILQWATYRDAADQTSLSRIWGGIHPPQDDIPGRIIGEKIGIEAFQFAESYFKKEDQAVNNKKSLSIFTRSQIFPNPTYGNESLQLTIDLKSPQEVTITFFTIHGKVLHEIKIKKTPTNFDMEIPIRSLNSDLIIAQVKGMDWEEYHKIMIR